MNEIVQLYAGLSAVLFDMDGVLTHNARFHEQAWRECAGQEYGVHIEEGSLVIHAGHTSEILQKLLGGPVAPEEVGRFHHLKESRYRELARGNLTPVLGLHRYLDFLKKKNLRLALVTGSDQTNVHFVLEALGVQEHFPVRITAEHFQKGKPSPECYLLALKTLGLTPDRVLVHEDSPGGVQAAVAAGCRVLALETTTTAPTLLHHGAVKVLPDFEVLLAHLTSDAASSPPVPLP